MGWLWGDSKTSPPKDLDRDPLRDLDPSLRDFLEKESPQKYAPPAPAPLPPPGTSDNSAEAPPPMLYSDGRYAHLWSNYKPPSQIAAESTTDQHKLLDMLDDYKIRKGSTGRAAMENCAVEQGALKECYDNGSWAKRMTMCRTENKAFDRCFVMQSRFLKALGYLSDPQSSAAVDEEIQMHADTLYHRMLSQEAAIEAAKAAKAPIPTFPPILSQQNRSRSRTRPSSNPLPSAPQPQLSPNPPQPAIFPASQPEDLPPLAPPPPPPPPPSTALPKKEQDFLTPFARAGLNARLAKLPPEERELEEQIAEAEARQYQRFGRDLTQLREDESRNRQERRERGVATAGDTISGWFGW